MSVETLPNLQTTKPLPRTSDRDPALSGPPPSSLAQRLACLVYAVVVYAFFLGTFLALIAFVGGVFLPRTVNSGATGSLATAIAVNASFLFTFGLQHTIMARPRFKAWITRFVPRAIERSNFVLVTSGLLTAMMVCWQPLPDIVWSVEHSAARIALHAVCGLGWATVLVSTFLIDHFDLFGLRQAWLHFRRRELAEHPFTKRSLYRFVRHPLMLGFLLALWSTPTMSQGHLLLAGLLTAHILCGIRFEERDLVRALGKAYEAYQRETPALIPWPRKTLASANREA